MDIFKVISVFQAPPVIWNTTSSPGEIEQSKGILLCRNCSLQDVHSFSTRSSKKV